MKVAITDQPFAARGTRRGGWPAFRTGFALATLGAVVSVFGSAALAAAELRITVTVRVYNYAHAPSATLAAAEREAGRILGIAGIQPVWVDCLETALTVEAKELCQRGWEPQTPVVRLLSGHTTGKFQDSEFGFAAVPVLATVSYEHVALRAQRDAAPFELPIILGCVMAHELGHLLLSTQNHSAAGIMQPQWGSRQIRQALTGALQFTPQQASLIREHARVLASLPPATPASALTSP